MSNVFCPNSSNKRKVIRGGAARGLSRFFWWFAQIKSNYLDPAQIIYRLVELKLICANLQKRLDKFSIWRYNRRRQHFAPFFDFALWRHFYTFFVFALWRRDLFNLNYFDQICKKDLTSHRNCTIIGAGSYRFRTSFLHFGAGLRYLRIVLKCGR